MIGDIGTHVIDCVNKSNVGQDDPVINADNLIAIVVYALLQARETQLLGNARLIRAFLTKGDMSRSSSYYLSTLEAAAMYIADLHKSSDVKCED